MTAPSVPGPDLRSVLAALGNAARGSGPSTADTMLKKTEQWRPDQLVGHQLWRLADILSYATSQVPYYRDRKAVYAVRGDLSLDSLRGLPVLSRREVLEHAEALRSQEPAAQARRWGRDVVRRASSSGSTGQHVTVQVDRTSAAMLPALAEREHRWHKRQTQLRAAAIRAVPEVSALRQGGLTWSAAGGKLSVLEVHTPVREQLDWLLERRPAYVSTYASNAAALLAEAERSSQRWPELLELDTFGELIGERLREVALRVWGVPVVDAYSCVELGFMALQCGQTTDYHVQSEQVLLEVLRADGAPCEPGETGRVVATALHAFAMPLVRYDLGDYATLGEACACGRGLPVLTRIVGRVRNMLRLRPEAGESADLLWPRYASNVLGGRFPIRQFRLVQRDYEVFELELVAEPLGAAAEAALRELVLGTLSRNLPRPPVLTYRYLDAIPRGAGGKFEDFLCAMP